MENDESIEASQQDTHAQSQTQPFAYFSLFQSQSVNRVGIAPKPETQAAVCDKLWHKLPESFLLPMAGKGIKGDCGQNRQQGQARPGLLGERLGIFPDSDG